MGNIRSRYRNNANLNDLFNNIIYAICDPITKNPFYIGQSANGLDRPLSHMIEDHSHNSLVNDYVARIKKQGNEPFIIILEYAINKDFLNDKEKFWITQYIKNGYVLLNFIDFDNTVNLLKKDHIISNNQNIGNYLKLIRMANNLSQDDLSKEIKLSRSVISKIENNTTTMSIENLLKYLNFFNLDLGIYSKT